MAVVLFVDCPDSYPSALPEGARALPEDSRADAPSSPAPDLVVIGPGSPRPTISAQRAAKAYPGIGVLITARSSDLERLTELLAITPTIPLTTELVAAETPEVVAEALRRAVRRCDLRNGNRRVLQSVHRVVAESVGVVDTLLERDWPPPRPPSQAFSPQPRPPAADPEAALDPVGEAAFVKRFFELYRKVGGDLTRQVFADTSDLNLARWPLRTIEASGSLNPEQLEADFAAGRREGYTSEVGEVGRAHAEAGLGFAPWLVVAHHFRRRFTERLLAPGVFAERGEERHIEAVLRGMEAFLHATVVELESAHSKASAARTRKFQTKAELFAVAVESSDDAILTTSLDGEITAQNPAAERLYGRSADQALGQNFAQWAVADQRERLEELLAAARLGGASQRAEMMVRARGGVQLTVEMTVSPVRGEGSAVVGLSVISRDLSEQRRAEAALRQSQKMEALGRLAGGIAHDFNNLLTVILSHASLLSESFGQRSGEVGEDDDLESVRDLLAAAERARALTAQLLTFSRRQPLCPRVLSAADAVFGTHQMLRRTLPTTIEVAVLVEEDLWPVYMDPVQFDQLLMNLALNGRDAMPNGGRLSIELANEHLGAAQGALAAGPYVALRVSDTGVGIPAAVLPRVFDPFYTTKAFGSGTGLGLATCYAICRQAGGDISVSSRLGVGTTFSARLPSAPRAAAPASAGLDSSVRRDGTLSGRETILVAEDDPSVRTTICATLQRHGYRVIEAENGDVALRKLASHAGPVHLLVTDIVMPQMGGPEVAAQLSAVRPHLPILFTTGYASEDAMQHRGLGRRPALLLKPFRPVDLLREVRNVLDRERARGAN